MINCVIMKNLLFRRTRVTRMRWLRNHRLEQLREPQVVRQLLQCHPLHQWQMKVPLLTVEEIVSATPPVSSLQNSKHWHFFVVALSSPLQLSHNQIYCILVFFSFVDLYILEGKWKYKKWNWFSRFLIETLFNYWNSTT